MPLILPENIMPTGDRPSLVRESLERIRICSDRDLTVGVATPSISVGEVAFNEQAILSILTDAIDADVDILLFSELALSGATCGDLFRQDILIDAVYQGLERIAQATEDSLMSLFLPFPLRINDQIVKAMALIEYGFISDIVIYPDEKRRVGVNDERTFMSTERLVGFNAPLNLPDTIETDDELSRSRPVDLTLDFSGNGIGEGASMLSLVLVPDARHEWTGDYRRLRDALTEHSLTHRSIVLYAGAGKGESVSEGVFAGHRLIACNGNILAEGQAFTTGLTTAVIRAEDFRRNDLPAKADKVNEADDKTREEALETYERFPFLMKKELDASSFCRETLTILGHGLWSRLASTGTRPVLGLSGGLDSALALIVCLEAAKIGGVSPETIIAVSMPGPGTSERSRLLARRLSGATRVDFREIDISEAVDLHLEMIGHNGQTHDVTYENAQARERTQILMDLANLERGLVVGTGDLSESALGWCTYNGDQMSMYSVNASVAKTAVRYLLETAATLFEEGESPVDLSGDDKRVIAAALREILKRPVSPELLPPHDDGSVRQITEDVVGPYEVIDFFLWHMIFCGRKPSVVYDAAVSVFSETYDNASLERWLKSFIKRFFRSQFKRSASPEGVASFPWRLSPQRAWSMPSDMAPSVWLRELSSHLNRL